MNDRFGNPIDPTVGYARGAILAGPDEEVARTLHSRELVRRRILEAGNEAVFDITGLRRATPIQPEDLPNLDSQFTFYAHFDGRAEPLALRLVKADPEVYDAVLVNRVSAAMLAVSLALLEAGDTVLSFVPRGRSHPSLQQAVERVGATFVEASGPQELQEQLDELGRVEMLAITPVTPAKHHLEVDEFRWALTLGRPRADLVFVDDAHMCARTAFFDDPTAPEMGDVDVLVVSSDKHMLGPRAGMLVARKPTGFEGALMAIRGDISQAASAARMKLSRSSPSTSTTMGRPPLIST